MHSTVTELFLAAMLIVFTLPYLVWRLTGKSSYTPLVVIQIVAGVLLGPGVMGQISPVLYDTIFAPPVITALNAVALWAVMMFVFVAGLELDLRAAWTNRRETAIVASSALLVPMVTGVAAGAIMLQWPGWIGENGNAVQVMLGIGMACAVTALPILIVFMQQIGILRQPLGQRVLRYASLDDVAIWAVLALILLDWDRVLRQVSFFACFALATLAMRWLIPHMTDVTDRWYAGLAWLIGCGLVADWAGLHYMVGAFLAGAVLDAQWFRHDRADQFRDTILMALMPVYFLSTGLRTNWDTGGLAVIAAAALLLVAAIGGKLAGVHIAGRILGWPRAESTVIGWLLQTKALIMIIFATVLLDRAIISAEAFTALLLMALGSTMLTLPVVLPRLAAMRAAGTLDPPP
jgi:Kef-type K+ transport system membrane component KefB